MSEQSSNQEYPADILVNLADMDQSLILVECEKYGLEQGWNDDYLSGVRESNQLFERFQALVLREHSLPTEIRKLEETRDKALKIAQNAADDARAEGFQRIAEQCKQDIKFKKQEAQNLKDQIKEVQEAYEQTANSTMASFNFPGA